MQEETMSRRKDSPVRNKKYNILALEGHTVIQVGSYQSIVAGVRRSNG